MNKNKIHSIEELYLDDQAIFLSTKLSKHIESFNSAGFKTTEEVNIFFDTLNQIMEDFRGISLKIVKSE